MINKLCTITYELFFSTDDPIVCTSSAQFSTKHFWWSEKKSFSQTNPYFENSFLVDSIFKIFEINLDQTCTACIHKVIGGQIRRRFNSHSSLYFSLVSHTECSNEDLAARGETTDPVDVGNQTELSLLRVDLYSELKFLNRWVNLSPKCSWSFYKIIYFI